MFSFGKQSFSLFSNIQEIILLSSYYHNCFTSPHFILLRTNIKFVYVAGYSFFYPLCGQVSCSVSVLVRYPISGQLHGIRTDIRFIIQYPTRYQFNIRPDIEFSRYPISDLAPKLDILWPNIKYMVRPSLDVEFPHITYILGIYQLLCVQGGVTHFIK